MNDMKVITNNVETYIETSVLKGLEIISLCALEHFDEIRGAGEWRQQLAP